MFSPDDKLVVTGVSLNRGETEGKLLFFDKQTLKQVYEIFVAESVSFSIVMFCVFSAKKMRFWYMVVQKIAIMGGQKMQFHGWIVKKKLCLCRWVVRKVKHGHPTTNFFTGIALKKEQCLINEHCY